MIRLYSWIDVENFGDTLSQAIVQWVSNIEVELVKNDRRAKLRDNSHRHPHRRRYAK